MRLHYTFDPERFLDPGARPEAGYASFLRGQLDGDEQAVFISPSRTDVWWATSMPESSRSRGKSFDRAGFLHDLVVVEDARRAGVATALLTAAIEWLATLNVPRVMLWTAQQNTAAQELFEKRGFRRTMVEMTRELS